jgi:hypothetical protein
MVYVRIRIGSTGRAQAQGAVLANTATRHTSSFRSMPGAKAEPRAQKSCPKSVDCRKRRTEVS